MEEEVETLLSLLSRHLQCISIKSNCFKGVNWLNRSSSMKGSLEQSEIHRKGRKNLSWTFRMNKNFPIAKAKVGVQVEEIVGEILKALRVLCIGEKNYRY